MREPTLYEMMQRLIGSPSVSYDGKSILVAMAADGDSFFHIYRVPVDGGPSQQLTDGPFHDIDPAELPDGRIVYASRQPENGSMYLSTVHPDGKSLYVADSKAHEIVVYDLATGARSFAFGRRGEERFPRRRR